MRKRSRTPGVGGNVLEMGSLMRVKNDEELERDVFLDGAENEDVDANVLIYAWHAPTCFASPAWQRR